jgi:hypothetical protein
LIDCALLPAIPRAQSQTTSTAAQAVLNELPPCSVLREQIEHGTQGDGIAKPYMDAMRSQGVKRTLLEIRSIWRGGKPTNLETVHRLYFDQFDGPNSQIVDSANLARIRQSGLDADLDRVADEQVRHARLFFGAEGDRSDWTGQKMYSYVDLMANQWVPEPQVLVSPMGKFPHAVVHAAQIGDQLSVVSELKNTRSSQRERNRALLAAVDNLYDNTAVMKALVNAGADINVHGQDGITPLMIAVSRPCNLQSLLKLGADVTARDKWSRDALRLAREVKQPISLHLLEEATAKKRPQGEQ